MQPSKKAAEQGNRALKEGRYQTALTLFQNGCQQQPQEVDNHVGLAICLHRLNQFPEAEAAYRMAIRLTPQDPELWANLGLVLAETGQIDAGCQSLEKAVQLAPHRADIHYTLGNTYQVAGDTEKALDAYQHALQMEPENYDCLINLGVLYKQQACSDKAEVCFRNALKAAPTRPEAYANLATLLLEKEAHGQAEAVAREGLVRAPQAPDLHYNLGNLLRLREAYPESLEAYQRALFIAPDHARAHWNKALAHLAIGQYQTGWREYEWRQKKEDWALYYPYRHNSPAWRGEDISGKTLLVHDEQGYGDTIQFSRYLFRAKKYCKRLIFETRKPLISLFQKTGHIDQLVERPVHRNEEFSWDIHVPLLSLPYLCKTEVNSIPRTTPYLFPDALKVEHYKKVMDRRQLNVGLVWAGNPKHRNDRNRSIPLSMLMPLFDLPMLDWHSLQKGPASEEIAGLPENVSILDWSGRINTFADTAALMWCLDLVISVDTAVAHLGGALGKPLWLMLPSSNVDWRWQLELDTSPWYPSMTLFRQARRADWSSVVDQIALQLRHLTDQTSSN